MSKAIIYMASSSESNKYGLTVTEFDTQTATFEVIQQESTLERCEYLNLHPNGKYLYAVALDHSSSIYAYEIDPATGKLNFLNYLRAEGSSPAYVVVDQTGRYALMVNYASPNGLGNIQVYPIAENGRLQAATASIEHQGRSINEDRQQESHPHMILPTQNNEYVIVPDLGTDKIHIYRLNTDLGSLQHHSNLPMEAGAGVRHVAFHPSQKYMYAINELNSTLVAYRVGMGQGEWHHLTIISTLPDNYDFRVPNYPSDVHVHPKGKFLYGANRGHDSLAIYTIKEETGIPSLIGHESTRGHWPRAFMIDPSGEYLIVGNRRTDDVQVFEINQENGYLTHQSEFKIPAPMAFRMRI